ncbi:MAG: hypothetical protein E6I50_05845, partial [Chloroflexi bacterium]
DRLAEAAADPGMLATDAAEDLVRSGTPFRKAHETVGRQVRDGSFQPHGNARQSVVSRDLLGGPNPGRVAARARAVRREAAGLRRWTESHPPRLPS